MGCRRCAPQGELVRLVRGPDASVQVGRTLPGRGAWLCAGSPACLQLAVRRNSISRALRAPVSADAIQALEPELTG